MKTVVVTGASRGLGEQIVAHLLSDGYRVVGLARSAAPDSHAGAAHYVHLQVDLSDIDSIPDVAKTIADQAGSVYGLVNNAASGNDGLLPTMHNSDIAGLLRTNLESPIVLTKYLSRPMLAKREGRIINISSIVAATGYRGLSVYAATKAGLEGFTRSLARDLGPRGVTVNCVAPGFLPTDMTANLGSENLERIRRRAALGRFPERHEVSAAVAYLLSPAGAGVSGTILTVDAGNTA